MSNNKDVLPDGALAQAAECLGILAHKDRLRIVDILLKSRRSVSELAEMCALPQSVTSEHLRLMQRCGFLDSEREGRFVFYEVVEPHLKDILGCIRKRFVGVKSNVTRN